MAIFKPFSAFIREPSILSFDFGFLESRIAAARGFFSASGRLWGYDPHSLAGHFDPSLWSDSLVFPIAGVLLPFLSAGGVIKLLTVISVVVLPGCGYVAWRGFGANRTTALVGALLTVLWFQVSEAFIFWATGMTSLYLAFVCSLLGLSSITALFEGRRFGWSILAWAPAALFFHKAALVTLFLPALAVVPLQRKNWSRQRLLILIAAVAATLVLNGFWIVAAVKYGSFQDFAQAHFPWFNPDPWAWIKDLTNPAARIGEFNRPDWTASVLFKDAVMIGAIAAFFLSKEKSVWGRSIGPAAVLAAIISYGGGVLPQLRYLQPSRFIPYFYLLMALPAAHWAWNKFGGSQTGRRGLFCLMAVMCLPFSPYRFFLKTGVPVGEVPELHTMREWIAALPGNERVLVETFDRSADAHLPWRMEYGLVAQNLPSRVNRLLLGGGQTNSLLRHGYAEFASGKWMGRSIGHWTEEALDEGFRRYCVQYVLTWSEAADSAFARYPDLVERVEAPEPFAGWKVRREFSYVLEGEGRLAEFGFDRLVFDRLKSKDGRVVVSFHWAPTLRAEGATLEPFPSPGDPVSLIALKSPSERVVITGRGAW